MGRRAAAVMRAARVLCMAVIGWGILFPELFWGEDTCRCVEAEDRQQEATLGGLQQETAMEGWQQFETFLQARPGEIRSRSKLLEIWNAFWKKGRKGTDGSMGRNRDVSAPIGVFDSGVGGLTVAREIMRQIPNEKIVYFGDTARVPYGSKSKETVTRFSRQIVRFLQTHRVKTIVVACNTASAYALEDLEKEFDVPIIGVVKPGAKAASQATRNGRIGVIATEATIGSHIYSQYIKKINPDVTIYGKACPLFVPLVEEGLWEDPVTDEIAKRYLNELIDIDIDTLILGCTHYPLIRSTVARVMGEKVTLVNPAFETARELRETLEKKGLLNDAPIGLGENKYQFYVSDGAEKFKTFANSIIKYGILSAKTVNIEEF